MTAREGEAQHRRQRAPNSTSLTDLAIEIVRDDPETSDGKLLRRWVVKVQDDDELLEVCLKEQGSRAIAIARSFIAREQEGEENKTSVKQHERRKKTAAEVRNTLFNLVAENGKKIRELTDDELDELCRTITRPDEIDSEIEELQDRIADLKIERFKITNMLDDIE
jgi:gas vesicle protein